MKIYLSGISALKQEFLSGVLNPEEIYALESYYSLQEWQKRMIPMFKSFICDSGAFTFMNNAKKHGRIDWEKYADEYADFIRSYKIKLYFELDIDSIVGLKKVENLRNRIETRVGWQSIPVFHLKRGKDYYEYMCKNYGYVAFGGILTDGVSARTLEKYFPYFINTAHKNGAKIHGLGYTSLLGLPKYPFDSVDSTTWIGGCRFGEVQVFKSGTIIKTRGVQIGKGRIKLTNKEINLHNFKEWIKYQNHADINF